MTRVMALGERIKKIAEENAKKMERQNEQFKAAVLECDRHTHAITTHRLLTDEAIASALWEGKTII